MMSVVGALLAVAALGWMGGLVGGSYGFGSLGVHLHASVLSAAHAPRETRRLEAVDYRSLVRQPRDVDGKL